MMPGWWWGLLLVFVTFAVFVRGVLRGLARDIEPGPEPMPAVHLLCRCRYQHLHACEGERFACNVGPFDWEAMEP